MLKPDDIPAAWFNVASCLPAPLAIPKHPVLDRGVDRDDLGAIFPAALIEQEMSADPWVDVPGEILDILRLWRPTPLVRAVRLERALQTPARIYFKDESVSPTGSHKANTAVAQAYYNKAEGIRRLTTETGAGQWGSALSMACQLFDLDCRVFMVAASHQQKPYRRVLMETWGAEVIASPSTTTEAGRSVRQSHPDSPGSLGIAISEAVEEAVGRSDTHYALGSVLNHVLLHQTVIGLEAREQLQLAGEGSPDIVIGACGGGSNFAGLALPFLQSRPGAASRPRLIAIEPRSCPSLTAGQLRYESGDTAGLTPRMWMYTIGREFVPPATHAGGLRYHGAAPILSNLLQHQWIEAVAYPQRSVLEAAVRFARTEGMVPAPETAHAIKGVIEAALAARRAQQEPVILFNYSGHGLLDLAAYDDYFHDRLSDD
ncbi:TrpB-like pyridoxal phosphate-dependent enzyme [Mycobacterium montefiorense]|uniref:TrpB-like pyridoxal phosphate-dependent enzyme n=1 Tax=Mycobacterium montefiorense TaxID=154654 RepID=UPI0027E03B3E|nr:TrpB-like pyridoxal phosphate-dependent enzyme [Mycobacterium montefiorense]